MGCRQGSPPATSSCSHRAVTVQWRLRGFTPTSCNFRAIDLFGSHTRDLPLSEPLHWSMRPFSISPRQVCRVQCLSGTSSSSHTPKPCGDASPAVLLVVRRQQQLHAGVGSRWSLTVALPVSPVSAQAEHRQGWHLARGWYRAAAWRHWCVLCVRRKARPADRTWHTPCSA